MRAMDSAGFHLLLRRARGGDRGAMDEVLDRLEPRLRRLARRYADPVRPVESTGDLLQDCCVRAWQKLETFQGGAGDDETFAMFRAWVGQIMHRVGLKAQRQRSYPTRNPPGRIIPLKLTGSADSTASGGRADPPASGPSPSENVRTDERTRRIEAILEGMTDETDIAIVRMHFFEDLSLPETADRLEIRFKEVRRRYRAVVRRLERDLKGWL